MSNVGIYVEYKSAPYLLVKEDKNYAWIIPGDNQGKRRVLKKNLRRYCQGVAKNVIYRGKRYLVTGKGLIVSLATHKVMQWPEDNGDRRAILKEAGL